MTSYNCSRVGTLDPNVAKKVRLIKESIVDSDNERSTGHIMVIYPWIYSYVSAFKLRTIDEIGPAGITNHVNEACYLYLAKILL